VFRLSFKCWCFKHLSVNLFKLRRGILKRLVSFFRLEMTDSHNAASPRLWRHTAAQAAAARDAAALGAERTAAAALRTDVAQLERALADAQRAKRAAAEAADAAVAELSAARTGAQTAVKEAAADAEELRTRIVVLETEIETVRRQCAKNRCCSSKFSACCVVSQRMSSPFPQVPFSFCSQLFLCLCSCLITADAYGMRRARGRQGHV
jgi:hypothetical protein